VKIEGTKLSALLRRLVHSWGLRDEFSLRTEKCERDSGQWEQHVLSEVQSPPRPIIQGYIHPSHFLFVCDSVVDNMHWLLLLFPPSLIWLIFYAHMYFLLSNLYYWGWICLLFYFILYCRCSSYLFWVGWLLDFESYVIISITL
jgi:hypothetical protein